ncbi:hypothetical protein ABAC460_15380 [Asticcacaulis sp. AC460]|uniref:hypothetical protein n=1 Tax=Asticcacaulis sp. AC460 TaxID=1282360 RepID=UPI0003C3FE00|nr:hypothetical protein [Asticcacaulis sp. AC460]ESQ88579.1 hypothetical protein ABAC460_15380 [Asticcacaulis sp. AC460]
MTVPPTARFLIAATVLTAAGAAHGHTSDRYLTWENKAQRDTAQAQQNVPQQAQPAAQYGVPTSPYGQVGNPYRQTLNWPTKTGPQSAPVQTANVERPPQQSYSPPPVVSVAVPRPAPRPQPVTVAPVPMPSSQAAPTPQPAFDDADEPEVRPRNPGPQAAVPVPQPKPEPQPLPVATAPVPTPATLTDGESGYQVPATSKYAARIAASRAAQSQEQSMAPAPGPDQGEPPQPTGPAHAALPPAPPAASQSLASQETDQVFIPGEQITNAVTQEPRRYSLHRQYGMRPDRIQVDPNPTGAILETRFDALEPEDDDDAKDAPSDNASN